MHGKYSWHVDIFALACIVVELYMMAPLFPGQTEVETMNKIVDLLGTPAKSEWSEGYKMASVIRNTAVSQITTFHNEKGKS